MNFSNIIYKRGQDFFFAIRRRISCYTRSLVSLLVQIFWFVPRCIEREKSFLSVCTFHDPFIMSDNADWLMRFQKVF